MIGKIDIKNTITKRIKVSLVIMNVSEDGGDTIGGNEEEVGTEG